MIYRGTATVSMEASMFHYFLNFHLMPFILLHLTFWKCNFFLYRFGSYTFSSQLSLRFLLHSEVVEAAKPRDILPHQALTSLVSTSTARLTQL